MDDQAYLEPDFDPSTLTVPRLRSVLLAHNVQYASSAKKPQLIELFNQHVKPQARKLRADSLRVKRTSRGIVNANAHNANTIGDDDDDHDDDDDEEEQPSTTTRSSRRTSTRARTEEPQEVIESARSTRHSTAPPEGTPRRSTSKHARKSQRVEEPVDEAEEEEEEKTVSTGVRRSTSSRKSRLSAVTPVVKRERDDDSPFSSENVFQSGGSPPAASDGERRRTTLSAAREPDRRRSSGGAALRRKTEDFRPVSRTQVDGIVSRRANDMPVSVLKKETKVEVEPMEEFTPEEAQELVEAQQAGEIAHPRRRRAGPTAGGAAARSGFSVVAVALLSGLAFLWGQEKFQVGYCDVGRHSQEIAGIEIPQWADVIRPQCEPCPAHAAVCDDNFRTICESGFVLVPHPLSLGGRLPLPPTCAPDSVKTRKVEAVKQRAVEELRTQNADYECGKASVPEIKETALKAKVSSQRRKGMSNEEFEALWESALPEIRKVEEVSEGTDGSTGEFHLRSHSLARITLACGIRRQLRQTLREHIWTLVTLLTILAGGAYTRYSITSGRKTESQAKQLASLALEKLRMQAALHAHDPGAHRENFVSMAQLRDDVLRDEFSSLTRKKLWEKVQRKVEHNSNVRPIVREGRSGEVGRTWEWIGTVPMLEGSSPDGSSGAWNRRRSGHRVSFGGERVIEPDESSGGPEMRQMGKWEEGKQYF